MSNRTLHNLHSLDVEEGAVGSTVRLGGKWADLKEGEIIELCVCTKDPETHDVQGLGQTLSLWFGRFIDVPAQYLRYEHEEKSREYSGLVSSMKNAYGEDFDTHAPVVVIMYRRLKKQKVVS